MRLSPQQIKALQSLFEEQLGLKYTDEEAQQAGLGIMRFVLAKHQRTNKLTDKKGKDNVKTTNKSPKGSNHQ